MACGCGKQTVKGVEVPTSRNMKKSLTWSIDRANMIAQLREEDMQVYLTSNSYLGEYYEIEPVNPNRINIIQVIKFN